MFGALKKVGDLILIGCKIQPILAALGTGVDCGSQITKTHDLRWRWGFALIGSRQVWDGEGTAHPAIWGSNCGLEGRSRAGVVREVDLLERLVGVARRVGGAPKLF